MQFDWTIQLGDVLMAVVATGLIPGVKLLASTLREMRMAVQELTFLVIGSANDPGSGIIHEVAALKKESQRHRNWLIEIQAMRGARLDDRS